MALEFTAQRGVPNELIACCHNKFIAKRGLAARLALTVKRGSVVAHTIKYFVFKKGRKHVSCFYRVL